MKVKKGSMISMPYSSELNDIPALLSLHQSPERFGQMICDQFDVLYEDGAKTGRVMSICLHPFLIGHPHRSKYLAKALAHITSRQEVWLATGSEIVDWYKKNYLKRDDVSSPSQAHRSPAGRSRRPSPRACARCRSRRSIRRPRSAPDSSSGTHWRPCGRARRRRPRAAARRSSSLRSSGASAFAGSAFIAARKRVVAQDFAAEMVHCENRHGSVPSQTAVRLHRRPPIARVPGRS